MEYKVIGDKRYYAEYDQDAYFHTFEGCDKIDFENEEDEKAYRKKFDDEELYFFHVIEQSLCPCCKQWSDGDIMSGIDAKSHEDAIDQYMIITLQAEGNIHGSIRV